MNKAAIQSLFDWMYWVNRRLLDSAAELGQNEFRGVTGPTTRDLRATLVHELDVEWSWRENLQGKPMEDWGPDEELRPEDFPDVATLRERWERDEAEMRSWLEQLGDADIEAETASAFTSDRLPLWQYLVHIVTHAAQQQADAATLLSGAGHSPGEIGYLEFLYRDRARTA
jgi:uncharacterized damage-inducible protein DinB